MKNNRILIVTGGTISKEFAKEYLKDQIFDVVIAVDSGLAYVEELNIPVHYIVGDFDSVSPDLLQKYENKVVESSIVIKKFNPIKDATDTQMAIELALELNAEEIVILGATGTRIDHMLANIHLLYLPLNKNIKAIILDEYNKIYLVNQNTTIYKNQLYGPYISLQPFTEVVTEVTLQGFKYPLMKRTMHIGDSLGVSNEVTSAQAKITIQSGILIVIESKD